MLKTRTRSRRLGLIGKITLALALAGGSVAAAPSGVQAADGPYWKGPAPTESSVTATTGPFRVTEARIVGARGFGGGRIYYPTDTSQGTFGAVAISPGFTAYWSSLSWLGPRLASQGFVVIGIETLTTADQPASRGSQLLAALDWAVSSSPAASRIDRNRLAVAGHSMGGGGSLEASLDRPSLKAAIPLAPWNTTKSWTRQRVPTLIIGGSADTIAPVATHSIPFYTSLGSPEKAYMELRGASHFFPQTPDDDVAKMMISWLKRFVDEDTRYSQFLCPGPRALGISDYRNTCPI